LPSVEDFLLVATSFSDSYSWWLLVAGC